MPRFAQKSNYYRNKKEKVKIFVFDKPDVFCRNRRGENRQGPEETNDRINRMLRIRRR